MLLVIDDDDDEGDGGVELEFSPLSQAVTRGDVTVEVAICRIVGREEGWALEVMGEQDTSTTWEELFLAEQAALDEFHRVLEEDGITSFLAEPPARLH